jgi:tetratricopeptide (TPR) repeat protein
MKRRTSLLALRRAVRLGLIVLLCPPEIWSQTKLPPELTQPSKPTKQPSNELRSLGRLLDKISTEQAAKANYPLLNLFVIEHPDFPIGYAVRAMMGNCLRDAPDLSQLESDIRKSMQDPEAREMLGNPLSILAKIDLARGDPQKAINELYEGASADWGSSNIFAAKPDPNDTPSFCEWNATDLDALARQFPRDWRIAALRGLDLESQAISDESLYTSAATQFHIAEVENPGSPIPPCLLGKLQTKTAFWTKSAWTSNAARNQDQRTAALSFTKAVERDPNFTLAYLARASSYLELKQDELAIRDFTKVLALDPQNESALADRGNAYSEKGEPYRAISDFSAAIPLEEKKEDLYLGNLHENRADEYVKVGDLRSAIKDYTSSITIQFGRDTIQLNVAQIRALYPELQDLSDERVVRMVHDQFYPEVDYEGFAEDVLHKNGSWGVSLLNDLYEKRGDAYLQSGDYRDGIADIQRIYRGIPSFADSTDRWRKLNLGVRAKTYYLDAKSSDISSPRPKLWIKILDAKGSEVELFALDCSSRRLSVTSSVKYDKNDTLLGSTDISTDWETIAPDTIGERLWSGACMQHP